MLTKTQQSVYRPVVEKAWLTHCQLAGDSPNNKPAKEAWYRDQVHSSTGKWSTRDVDPVQDFQPLLDRFMMLAGDPQPIMVHGWSDAQNAWFSRAAVDAWNVAISTGSVDEGLTLREWVSSILVEQGIMDHSAHGNKKPFDDVMAALGVISGDERLIDHFCQASERRMRWQIKQFMSDLAHLENREVTWDYMQAIWSQSELLPSLEEAPAATLQKLLQMLDTHIRRKCEAVGIRPKDLPSRK